jgi:hypothetical protein
MQDSPDRSGNHQALIEDQFTQQAELFANAPALHNAAALESLVLAAAPKIPETCLDVACGRAPSLRRFRATFNARPDWTQLKPCLFKRGNSVRV